MQGVSNCAGLADPAGSVTASPVVAPGVEPSVLADDDGPAVDIEDASLLNAVPLHDEEPDVPVVASGMEPIVLAGDHGPAGDIEDVGLLDAVPLDGEERQAESDGIFLSGLSEPGPTDGNSPTDTPRFHLPRRRKPFGL